MTCGGTRALSMNHISPSGGQLNQMLKTRWVSPEHLKTSDLENEDWLKQCWRQQWRL